MSQPQADDPDPLLEFSAERSAVIQVPSARKAGPQPVEAPVDPAPALPKPSPSVSAEALLARINRLESALVDSKFQVSTLKSELATLVRAIGDIKKQSRREKSPEISLRGAVKNPGIDLLTAVRAPKKASALLGAIVGLGFVVFGWVYFTGAAADTTLVGSAPEPQETTVFVPADQPVAPAELETPSPPARVPARVPARAPARVVPVPVAARAPAPDTPVKPDTPIKYVGSLSIDSKPGDGEVFLNRESAGRTPLRLNDLKAGSHLIWVERAGYRRWTRVVQVPSNRVTRLFADLEPTAAR